MSSVKGQRSNTVSISSLQGGKVQSGLVLEDPWSSDNFMMHKLAKKLGLPSKPVSLSIRVLEDRH